MDRSVPSRSRVRTADTTTAASTRSARKLFFNVRMYIPGPCRALAYSAKIVATMA
jgi:hypothetical protein